MRWQGLPVLITGAGGFIGSHLTDALVRQGATVRAFVRYTSRGTSGWLTDLAPDVFSAVEVVQGDLRDPERVVDAVRGQKIIFHLGAMISIPFSYVSPSEAVAVNVGGTLNVLNACRRENVTRLVHVSTSETYGTAQYVPIDERHPLQGQSPYSASKIGADQLVESFHRAFTLPVATVRPFNTYGPRQSARAIIPTIVVQMLAGNEIRLGALTPTRDFTYVDDTVRGMLRAAEVHEAVGRTINLGSGTEISIGDLAARIAQIMGKKLRIEEANERVRPESSEVRRLLADNRLAGTLLDWRPETAFDDGLKLTVKWLGEHVAEYRRGQIEYVI